jgi:hypothetical protein
VPPLSEKKFKNLVKTGGNEKIPLVDRRVARVLSLLPINPSEWDKNEP